MEARQEESTRELLRRPVFLVGAMRSGTSLTRLMLDHHPQVAFEHEFDLATQYIAGDGALPEVNDFCTSLETHRGMNYTIDPSLDYRSLVDSFLRQKQSASGDKPIVGATVHHHFERLVHVWSDARFIHLVRDPRDVAQSVVDKGWSGNVYEACRSWLEAERLWEHFSKQIAEDRRLEVRYEDLVSHPVEQLTRICEFIGVDYDPATLDYNRTAVQYPAPDARLAYGWKRKQSPGDTARVESRTRRLIAARGYELSGLPERKVGRLEHEWLLLHSRLVRFRRRHRLLGWRLQARDVVSRRLGLETMQRQVVQDVNAIHARLIEEESRGLRAPSRNIVPVGA